ncbi:hypothetical protein ACFQL8_15375 [Streptomyces goshikiensis]|uniref:hypothetical protein n=1 Tax=Streptomyces goshikiensis TaxID=1942 RepID=UPI00167B260A|nr:hypothetical protein [Streptomyces goshikiensis]
MSAAGGGLAAADGCAEVIGGRLEIAALGMGHRQIAARLGLAEGTVRGWPRRFLRRSEAVRRYLTVALVAVAVAVADDPVMPEAAASPLADAVTVIVAAHRAAAVTWLAVNTVSQWAFAGRAIGGRVLRAEEPRPMPAWESAEQW